MDTICHANHEHRSSIRPRFDGIKIYFHHQVEYLTDDLALGIIGLSEAAVEVLSKFALDTIEASKA